MLLALETRTTEQNSYVLTITLHLKVAAFLLCLVFLFCCLLFFYFDNGAFLARIDSMLTINYFLKEKDIIQQSYLNKIPFPHKEEGSKMT